MISMPSCILYSRDDELAGRLIRIASSIASIHPIETQEDLDQWLAQFGETVLLADLRAPNCLEVLASIKETRPTTIIIVIGADRSDPMLAAELLNPYATSSLEPDRRNFQALLKQAIECFTLRQKNQVLADEIATLSARQNAPRPESRPPLAAPLQNFTKAQRNFGNTKMLFDSVVDSLVDTARVSRAGIFIRPDGKDDYIFQSGTRCLSATQELTFPATDPFVRWLELNTHLVSRKALDSITEPESRAMLKHALDSLGAEIIIPLYANSCIKGWIFVGQRSTGIPFDIVDLEELTGLADHISTTLEKALQYEETALQKTLAETLLHSIPFGIVACDENAVVRWFNNTARRILQPTEEKVIGTRVEILGSRVADMLRRTLESEEAQETKEWSDNRTKLTVSAETRCLMDDDACIGVMMMLHDVTGAKLLQEKEDQLERAAFWNELASSMSHEIRNPLVAIKTFAQLLPERYEDPDFRAEFSEQVTTEVDQLNHIIDKINKFANPPEPVYKPLDVRKPIEHAVTRIQSEFDHDNLKIHLSADDSDLQINGDAHSLEECFYHLLMNAAEHLDNQPGSRVNVTVKGSANSGKGGNVHIMIADNGNGIDESVRDKVYSPFSTIKARGLGLGIPIAKRAVIDHNGQMDIDTGSGGTTVTLVIPALEEEA